ncbi:MAG: glycosyltransferase family 4 protein [Nostoc sp.]|uniref:glycosyltransferase family 4 protein n=1 Tax=Nostoc sp. TaxID=1180 RepID=UPI002FFBA9FF
MEKIKSIFLPKAFVEGNPYITQLSENLEKVGIKLAFPSLSSSTTFFLPLVILQEKADFVHFHWLDTFFAYPNQFNNILKLLIVVFQLILLKLFGIKIIWTVHNLKNHENINLTFDRIYSIIVAELSNAIITHCQVAKEEVIQEFYIRNKDKVFVVPHGNYIDFYENKIEKVTTREKLGLKDSNLVFLFLGSIRPYKGVFELIDTFNQIHSEKIQLVIAGRVHNDSQEITDMLKQKIANDQRIKFFPGFVPNDEVQLYMNACDAVIFPYRDILTSGAVLLAMSFGRACIAPRKGCIGEVLDEAGAFLYQIDDENGLMNAMNSAVKKHDELFMMGEHNLQLAKEYNWKNIAEMTADVYYHC